MDEEKGFWRTSPELWLKLKPEARGNRHSPTAAEERLWAALRGGRLGVRFRRQHIIGRFIVDFYCPAARLVIEVDGPIHEQTAAEDALRQEFPEQHDLAVLRFTNATALNDRTQVISDIQRAIAERSEPNASRSPSTERETEGVRL